MRLGVLVALAFIACLGLGPRPAEAGIDRSCVRTHLSPDKAFKTFWLAEDIGLVGWRERLSLDVYDRCDHGGIVGQVSVYAANIEYEGGTYFVGPVRYRVDGGAWRTSYLSMQHSYSTGGWDLFDVYTEDNIGLFRTSRITHVKVPMWLQFYGVPGAGRRVECNLLTHRCYGFLGL